MNEWISIAIMVGVFSAGCFGSAWLGGLIGRALLSSKDNNADLKPHPVKHVLTNVAFPAFFVGLWLYIFSFGVLIRINLN